MPVYMVSSVVSDVIIQQGDIVFHEMWGPGRVSQVDEDQAGTIVIDFRDKPDHKMSLAMAQRSLKKLPAEGLEALIFNDFEKPLRWSKSAPLKLVGAALTDLGGGGSVSDLRLKLEGRLLTGMKWETWWKKVQPAIKDTPHFRIRAKKRYELVSPLNEIPETPLSGVKKDKTAKLTQERIQILASEMERKQLSIEDVRGRAQQRQVVRELVARCVESECARETVWHIVSESGDLSKVVVDELYKAERLDDLVEALYHMVQSMKEDFRSSSVKRREKVAVKLHVLEKNSERIVPYLETISNKAHLSNLVSEMVELSLIIWKRQEALWRLKALEHLGAGLAAFAEHSPELMHEITGKLTSAEGSTEKCLGVFEYVISRSDSELRSTMIESIISNSLIVSPELAWQCLNRYMSESDRVSWLYRQVHVDLSIGDESTLVGLAEMAARMEGISEGRTKRQLLESQIALAAYSDIARALLKSCIKDGLQAIIELPIEATPTKNSQQLQSLIDILESSFFEAISVYLSRSEQTYNELASTMDRKEADLQTSKKEVQRLEMTLDRLRRTFRFPEEWAQFEGQSKVLQDLCQYYQELCLVSNTMSANHNEIGGVLIQIENILAKYGVYKFGELGTEQVFNASQYEFIPGYEAKAELVEVKCPGFKWKDPKGSPIILARAQVTGR